ncbi:MAG: hypothetical protein C4293_01570 [Nitrospiraceae bacterium]
MNRSKRIKRYFVTGLFVLLPASGTFLILHTLFGTVDGLLSDLLGPAVKSDIPGLGIVSLFGLIVLTGIFATHVLGQQLVNMTEEWVRRIPLVRTIYLTLKGMTDLFNFRSRFGLSTVVVFPFPRDGLWALGFVMGSAPPAVQAINVGPLLMVFVPTAIHPFTGYLAFIPEEKTYPINLLPEDAMKMEFSAGLFRPRAGWLTQLRGQLSADR